MKRQRMRLSLQALPVGITPENVHGGLDWGADIGNELWRFDGYPANSPAAGTGSVHDHALSSDGGRQSRPSRGLIGSSLARPKGLSFDWPSD